MNDSADDGSMNDTALQSHAVVSLRRPDETADLIHRIACGDADAFARLYDEVAPMVYGISLRVLRDKALAEEVTQDVLLAIWQQAARFRFELASGRTWVAMIAHRRAVDRVRSEQAVRNRNDRYGRNGADRSFDHVVEMVETRFDHSAVAAALSELPAPQRHAVTLAYFGGHTYRDVAQMLEIPLGTVKTRIRIGLISLRAALEASGAFATPSEA